jgi:hypothetical protein
VVWEYGLRFVPSAYRIKNGTMTFTLPYAGANRIRFEGLPALAGSQSD